MRELKQKLDLYLSSDQKEQAFPSLPDVAEWYDALRKELNEAFREGITKERQQAMLAEWSLEKESDKDSIQESENREGLKNKIITGLSGLKKKLEDLENRLGQNKVSGFWVRFFRSKNKMKPRAMEEVIEKIGSCVILLTGELYKHSSPLTENQKEAIASFCDDIDEVEQHNTFIKLAKGTPAERDEFFSDMNTMSGGRLRLKRCNPTEAHYEKTIKRLQLIFGVSEEGGDPDYRIAEQSDQFLLREDFERYKLMLIHDVMSQLPAGKYRQKWKVNLIKEWLEYDDDRWFWRPKELHKFRIGEKSLIGRSSEDKRSFLMSRETVKKLIDRKVLTREQMNQMDIKNLAFFVSPVGYEILIRTPGTQRKELLKVDNIDEKLVLSKGIPWTRVKEIFKRDSKDHTRYRHGSIIGGLTAEMWEKHKDKTYYSEERLKCIFDLYKNGVMLDAAFETVMRAPRLPKQCKGLNSIKDEHEQKPLYEDIIKIGNYIIKRDEGLREKVFVELLQNHAMARFYWDIISYIVHVAKRPEALCIEKKDLHSEMKKKFGNT